MSEKNTRIDFIFELDDCEGLKRVRIFTPLEKHQDAMKLYDKLMPEAEAMDRLIQREKGSVENDRRDA